MTFMKLKHGLLIRVVLFQFIALGQTLSPAQIKKKDSLTSQLKADSTHIYRFQKYRPYINLDQRNSFIRNQAININGLQFGLLLNEKHVFGLVIYSVTSNSQQKVKTNLDNNLSAYRTLSMSYLTFCYQYVALDK